MAGSPCPTLDEFLAALDEYDPSERSLPFDRMMFDVCGEVNHVCAAYERDSGDVTGAMRAFDRACGRVYSDVNVSDQRKFSLRVAEWVFKAWCLWGVPGISKGTARRWFDAWQRERNLALLAL